VQFTLGRALLGIWTMGARSLRLAATMLLCSVFSAPQALTQPSSVQPGTIERGEQQPPTPKASSDIAIPEVTAPAPDGSFDAIKLTLKDIVIEGNAAIDEATLKAEFAGLIGREVTLSKVFAGAQAVTKLYADRGYALCLAYLPAQDIEGGVVRVRVVEGYIEAVEVAADDAKLARVVGAYGEPITASRPLRTAVLERYLLLANDLPGVRVRSVVDKGSGAPGAMKLILRVERREWDASLSVDNRGTRALGPERGRIDLAGNGLVSARERLSFTYMRGIDNDELDYLAGAFAMTLNAEGTVFSVDASNTNSVPGTDDLAAIEFQTRGLVAGAKVFHPVVRSRAMNLFGEIGFTYKDLQGDILGLPNSDDRLSVASFALHHDLVDGWDGISAIDLTVSQGLDLLDATDKNDPFPSRAGADATFTRIELSASRAQSLDHGFELYAALSAQYADSALLSSEQCGYGGARFGRAFDAFEIAGDHCAMAQAELRHRITPFSEMMDYLQLYVFADTGWVQRRGLVRPGELEDAHAQSAGAGVRLGLFEHVDASIEYADPLGDKIALEGDSDGRAFFSISVRR